MSWVISADDRREMARIYVEERLSTTKIAKQFGISQGHVSKLLKQEGVVARAFSRPTRFDVNAVKVCECCGAEFRRGITRTGRVEKPHMFDQRRFCSKECRSAHIGAVNKTLRDAQPWTVSKRTLVAKTCPGCGQLLPASRFQRQARGFYATKCGRCVQREWMASLPEDRRVEVERARMVQAKTQNDEMRDNAHRNGELWTGPELELLERRDLTAVQLAAMLGRTPYAVGTQRHLLNKADPVKTFLAGVSVTSGNTR